MSKAGALAATGIGGGGMAIGGYYVFGRGGGGSGEATTSTEITQENNQAQTTLSFNSLDEFKKEPAKVDCVKNLFSGLQANTSAEEIASQKPGTDSFFKTATGGDDSQKGCLLVEYKKETYDDSKWKGKIFWLWAFSTGDEGFINFTMAETSTTSKLKFSGAFYLVGKKSAPNDSSWEIKYKAETSTATEVESASVDEYFPKPASTLAGAVQNYWGFFSTKDEDMKKICSESECTTAKQSPSVEPKKFSWTKKDSSDKSLKDWTDKLDWWSKLHSTANTHWNLSNKIQNFKGEWQEDKQSQTNPS